MRASEYATGSESITGEPTLTRIRAKVLVTGTSWIGKGIGSIETAVTRLFQETKTEISMTVYALSNSADAVLDSIEDALARGIRVKLIINNLDRQKRKGAARLRQLSKDYPHFLLYDFKEQIEADLHAKAMVFDRRYAVVGSSNLSRRGMLINHEIAILIDGPPAVDVAKALDSLFESKHSNRVT